MTNPIDLVRAPTFGPECPGLAKISPGGIQILPMKTLAAINPKIWDMFSDLLQTVKSGKWVMLC